MAFETDKTQEKKYLIQRQNMCRQCGKKLCLGEICFTSTFETVCGTCFKKNGG